MKLTTHVSREGPAVGAIVSNDIVDLSAQFLSMLAFIEGGDAALTLAQREIQSAAKAPLSHVRLLSPVPELRQIRDLNNSARHMRDAPASMAGLKAKIAGQPERDHA